MSHVLNGLLNSTFVLLLENEENGDECEHLVVNLDKRIEKFRASLISDDLYTSLTNLKCAVASLRSCCENQDETRESQATDHSNNESELSDSEFEQRSEFPDGNSMGTMRPETGVVSTTPHSAREEIQQPNYQKDWKGAQLANEIREIEADDGYATAMKRFQETTMLSATVFENENESKAAKITATKVLVICEILGNLTDLDTAAKNCIKHISQLHGILRLGKAPFPMVEKVKHFVKRKLGFTENIQGMDAIVHINVVVFQFMKEFIRKPVAILDWPIFHVISQESYVESYHPILGKPSPKIAMPDPFIPVIDRAKVPIDCSSFSIVINCCGEIFTKDRRLGGIIRVTPSQHMKRELYSIHDELDTETHTEISSMSVDCSDCTSQAGEASPSTSNAVGRAPSNTECKSKIYILARCESEGKVRCFLYVMDMKGNKERRNELKFLERSASQDLRAKIFCVKDKKAVILDVTRRIIHILDEITDSRIMKYSKTLQLGNVDVSTNPLFTVSYNSEMVCTESRSKLTVYSIVTDEENSQLTKTGQVIETQRFVQDVAYNHESEQVIVLCCTDYLLRYHLVTYSKDGQLKKDIELHNGNYRQARLISHYNGSVNVILLDTSNILYLKLS